MIKFDDALQLMKEQDLPHVKIIDATGKRIMQYDEFSTVEETVEKLKEKKEMLTNFGRVTFIVGDEAIKKGNWTNAYHWHITFSDNKEKISGQDYGHTPRGYMSEREANLLAENKSLHQQMEFDKKFDELNRKLEEKGKDSPADWLPMIAGVMKIIKGEPLPQQNIAGTETKKQLTKMSDSEIVKKVEETNAAMQELGGKIGIDKLFILVDTLNKKPELADGLITLINNPAKMEAIKAFL